MKAPPDAPSAEQRFRKHKDQDSFEELYRVHASLVYRIIAKIVLDEGVAEDLCQETFVKAYTKIDQFTGSASFKTWLCRIAVNGANEHLRKKITARTRLQVLAADAGGDSGGTCPRQSLFWKESYQGVTAALARLEPSLRTAIILTVMEGMDPADAARAQGCSRATLYWRVHQARKQLKQELGHA
ncbi:MAG: sigma-70 family RNA polymerase sigma factor [Verrucomicrobia bacterium]|nr:sigma-70 family RNA polymerase sigma factor [Verrucomicrobiota bacterium]MCH8525890.1 sigma-70 family RNA polymerase sigma factor [Kiritimatiellia bacterium]